VRGAVASGERIPRHGTVLGYRSDLCRCVECRTAERVYYSELRRHRTPRQGANA
jgi:hypothetical protein